VVGWVVVFAFPPGNDKERVMRKVLLLLVLSLGVAAGSLVWADHHEGEHNHGKWFDAAACDVCKPWTENPALMMSTKWESHRLKNGMLMVSMVPKDQMDAFTQVCQQMDVTIEKIATGEQPEGLCGFCQAMGGLKMAGAKVEKVDTEFGNITLVTAENPETVQKIHKVLQRSQKEAKKLAELMKKAA
jgi:hypothetical protein